MSDQFREIVVRRVRLREDLKPVNTYWNSVSEQPDWLFITHVTRQGGYESFDLQGLKVWSSPCNTRSASVRLTGYIDYETLQIAKDQAHADLGVDYVEWEPCHVEITNPDGTIDWARAVPPVESPNSLTTKST